MPVDLASASPVTIPTSDRLHLHARFWAHPDPRGVLIVVHGFGEHSGCYQHVAEAVRDGAGMSVLGVDLRGHGRSPGRRGVVRTYDDLTSDLLSAVDWVDRRHPGVPRYILGHSNGGQVALRATISLSGDRAPAGLILSNPSLRLSFPVPRHMVALGRILLYLAPSVTLPAPVVPSKLSSDPAMTSFYLDDPLRHARMSAPLYFGMIDGGRRLLERLEQVTTRVLMIIGGRDPVVDPEACRQAFERIGSSDKSLLFYPEMLHEPFNELGREKVIADLVDWLKRRVGSVVA
ncbi:MAG: alpha/beta hydrolase [Isosphaeraceae bacterium]